MKTKADKVRLTDRITCSDGTTREVEMIERGQWDDGPAFRFTFTDGHWLECPIEGSVTRLNAFQKAVRRLTGI